MPSAQNVIIPRAIPSSTMKTPLRIKNIAAYQLGSNLQQYMLTWNSMFLEIQKAQYPANNMPAVNSFSSHAFVSGLF